jgi:uridine kinase
MGERVTVTVSGPTGSGKSAVMGEIEIALRALGLTVEHDADFQSEKNMTHADWQTALDLYKPTVVLREVNEPRGAQP